MAVVEETFPTDWPKEWQELQGLDGALRCPICYDFINVSMILPNCSHNYCSLCIRRYIGYKTRCPTCSMAVSEPELRNNRLLDDIVRHFLQLRPTLLKLVKASSEKAPAVETPSKRIGADTINLRDAKRPRLELERKPKQKNEGTEAMRVYDESHGLPQQQQSEGEKTARMDNKKPLLPQQQQQQQQQQKQRDGEEGVRIPNTPTQFPEQQTTETTSEASLRLPKPTTSVVYSSSTSAIQEETVTSVPPPCATSTPSAEPACEVTCPVCRALVKQHYINLHLDKCLTQQQESLKPPVKLPGRRPLPKLVYTLLSDKQLKSRLKEHGVSTQGNRQVLVRRHQEFLLLYNAECDSLHPRPVPALVAEVEKAERVRKGTVTQSKLPYQRAASPSKLEKNKEEYLKKHDSHFVKIITAMRERQRACQKQTTTASASRGQHCAASAAEQSGSGGATLQRERSLDESTSTDSEVVTSGGDVVTSEAAPAGDVGGKRTAPSSGQQRFGDGDSPSSAESGGGSTTPPLARVDGCRGDAGTPSRRSSDDETDMEDCDVSVAEDARAVAATTASRSVAVTTTSGVAAPCEADPPVVVLECDADDDDDDGGGGGGGGGIGRSSPSLLDDACAGSDPECVWTSERTARPASPALFSDCSPPAPADDGSFAARRGTRLSRKGARSKRACGGAVAPSGDHRRSVRLKAKTRESFVARRSVDT